MTKTLLYSVSIKDCEVQVFRGSGDGGQKKQKTSSGVRVIHHPSGAVGKATDNRQQIENKRSAFIRMVNTPEFKLWQKIETARRMGEPTIDELVDQEMQSKNLKIEMRDEDGEWVKEI